MDEEIRGLWEGLEKEERQFCFAAYVAQLKTGTNAKLNEDYYKWKRPHELGFTLRVDKNCFVTGNLFRKLLKINLGLNA